jgi:glucokinase
MKLDSSNPTGNGRWVVGVDVGGTKIAAGVVGANGQVQGRVKLPTDTSRPEMTLQAIAHAVKEALQGAGLEASRVNGIGLGIPGKVDPATGVSLLAVNLGWQDVPVKSWLENQLNLPCAIENDVAAGALGESLYGAGKGLENLVYISLGTGIAARVIIEGRLYRGSSGLAGEIGHISFDPNGPVCRCGGTGCLEALAAGPALAQQAEAALQAGRSSLIRELPGYGPKLSSELVFEAASQGDTLANEIITGAGSHLAYAIYMLAMSFNPQAIILGGGLSQAGNPLIAAIETGLAQWVPRSPIFREVMRQTTLKTAGLTRDAGIVGAAAVFNATGLNQTLNHK